MYILPLVILTGSFVVWFRSFV